jgi:uncharacterized coiled-coil protein SlyX
MDKEHDINQLSSDLNKIMNMFRKVESSALNDVDNLKEELKLLTKELKNRYGSEDTSETDS